MAQPPVITVTPPPVAAGEHDPASPLPKLQTTPECTAITSTDSHQSQELPPQQSPNPSSPRLPHFIDSITELRDLSEALSAFHRCYDDLQNHLNSIKSAIDSKLPSHVLDVTFLSPTVPAPRETIPIATLIQPTPTPSSRSNPSDDTEIGKEESTKPVHSELESLCVAMSSRGLRKYMVTNLGKSNKLREEVPRALKLAPNPAKLVLECSGRFFLQGIKAYVKDSPMIPAREASVLVLECFLLMGGEDGLCTEIRIEKGIKEEAAQAAAAWRKRLINEGGLAKACEIDARGLLMFLGCFGVPGVFKYEDFRDLVRAGNVKESLGVLKRSRVLMEKIPDVIEGLRKIRMAVDAVDIAYTFGFQDKFTPQTILTSFLRDSKESWKRTRKASQGSVTALNEANKKQLAALRSVVKCLEIHKIDPSQILPGWQINEKILNLEKDITDFENNTREITVQKRKADDIGSSMKRSRYNIHSLQQQKAAAAVDRHLLDGIPVHANSSYASPSVFRGTAAGLLPDNISGSGLGGSLLGAGVGGITSGAAGLQPTSAYAGHHSGALVDTTGQIINYNGQPYGLRGDAAYGERLVAHSYAGHPSSLGLTSFYRPSASSEGFAGLPTSATLGVPSRSSTSDLYHFADTVVESEAYQSRGSRAVGAVPPVAPAHHSSYFY